MGGLYVLLRRVSSKKIRTVVTNLLLPADLSPASVAGIFSTP